MAAKLEKTKTPGIYKRGSRYVVVYYVEGKQVRETCATMPEAKRIKARRTTQAHDGELFVASRTVFAEYAKKWVERYYGKPGREFRESTRDDYRRDLKYAFEFFGPKLQLRRITPTKIAEFVAWLNDPIAQGRQFAPSTLRNKVAPVAACLATATEERLIRDNPAARVSYPGKRFDAWSVDADEPAKAFMREQLRVFLAKVDREYRLMFEFLAVTGLRVGELIALEWRDLHLDGDVPIVKVRRQFYRGRVQPPKSSYGKRDVPLSLETADKLRDYRASLDPRLTADEAFVFHGRHGVRLRPNNVSRRVLKPAAGEAGAEWAGFHTFRHTCASNLFAAGRNVKQVQAWLGHHSADFTLRTYVHLMDEGVGEGLAIEAVTGRGDNKVTTYDAETGRNAESEVTAKTA